ncbi:MAG: hypothetical protein WD118_12130 [Phycisphaeraceae bacterium]
MLRRACLLTLMAMLAMTAAACAPQYVNIPAQRGGVALNNPNASNVRIVETLALDAVLRDRPLDGPVLINLPEGTEASTYAAVAAELDATVVTPHDEATEPASTLTVRAVRIRSSRGEVDVIRPRGGQAQQLVTVHLSVSPLSGWSVDRVHAWQGVVDE